MLELRPEQVAVLRRPRADRFRDAIAEHLRRFFTEEVERIAAPELPPWVERVLARGLGHGLRKGTDLCLFASLAMTFGEDFDTRPWAAEVLASPRYAGHPGWRIRRLYRQAMRVLEDGE